jgi:S-adenosylhomocysteine hydrolase
VPSPHTAEVIAEELNESLVAWNLDEKVSTPTVDNFSTNDKVIDLLVRKIGKDKLMLKGSTLHIRCCAHILNLIVKDGLDIIHKAIERMSHPGFRGPKPGREHNHQVCWDQVSHI